MCGIAGFFDPRQVADAASWGSIAQRMADALHHRGPDDSGVWVDDAEGVALAHRRLSILDLSPAGHQPMASAYGRYVVVFNGEIYNHLNLRRELEKSPPAPLCRGGSFRWRGHSDTETLLAAVSAWGMERALRSFTGMFAFALWDRQERTLTLARDRLGEKPLYYGWSNGVLLFGSELKALRAHPAFGAEIDRDALALFLRHNYVPAPHTIYRGIHKLPPGAYLRVCAQRNSPQPPFIKGGVQLYWSAREGAEAGARAPFDGDWRAAREELERLLRASIAGQMVADVPLGAFLSGGIDSSTVVALMQAQSRRPVKTFTIGFWEKGYNEAEHAKAVARHLGTEHTELYVTEDEALEVIPRLPELYDEPFADSSQIPTFLVSQMASGHVTVSLSGDGGDELFGGYNRYFWARRIWRKISWMPHPLRQVLDAVLTGVPPVVWNRVWDGLGRLLPDRWRYANPGDKLHKLAGMIGVRTPEEIYLALVSHWEAPADLVRDGREQATVLTDRSRWAQVADFEHRMMYLDTVSYLPDDILVKVDRAAMGVSLETRVPLLDHRLVEFAWRLPLSMKIRDGGGKWLLRQVLDQYVPRALIDRPKTGFGVPLDVWLRGPLRSWAEALLDESRLRSEGFFNPAPIRRKWSEHLSGRRNWAYHLWDVLMFQAWLEHGRAA